MAEICPICGLPKDLCVCKQISQEQQRIVIKLEKVRFGKPVTIVNGIVANDKELRKLAQALKSLCACGGTAKDNKILLQGDHRSKVRDYLVRAGYKAENIDVE